MSFLYTVLREDRDGSNRVVLVNLTGPPYVPMTPTWGPVASSIPMGVTNFGQAVGFCAEVQLTLASGQRCWVEQFDSNRPSLARRFVVGVSPGINPEHGDTEGDPYAPIVA